MQAETEIYFCSDSGNNSGDTTTERITSEPSKGNAGESGIDVPMQGKFKVPLREKSKRPTKKPSKFLEYTPPSENRPRGEKVPLHNPWTLLCSLRTSVYMCKLWWWFSHLTMQRKSVWLIFGTWSFASLTKNLTLVFSNSQAGPLHPKRYVWLLHPDHPNETIALGQTSSHWKSNKTKFVPNVSGVLWENGMQQVTVEHVYPQWTHVIPLYPDQQREGLQNMGEVLKGDYAEDSTILWKTRFLNYVQVAKKWLSLLLWQTMVIFHHRDQLWFLWRSAYQELRRIPWGQLSFQGSPSDNLTLSTRSWRSAKVQLMASVIEEFQWGSRRREIRWETVVGLELEF